MHPINPPGPTTLLWSGPSRGASFLLATGFLGRKPPFVDSSHRRRPNGGVWLPLDDLLAELGIAGVAKKALSTLFGVFERFPNEDGVGIMWSIVHGIENLGFDDEQPWSDSFARQPSDMGKNMIDRLKRYQTGHT